MGYEKIVDQSEPRGEMTKPEKTIYYTYKMPEDGLKDNQSWLQKGKSIEGYYLNSYVSPKSKYPTKNHVLVTTDNTHHILPGASDIDKAFANERINKAVMTKFTYSGRQKFEYKKEDGTMGEASAMKCLIEQDKDQACTFIGDVYSAKVSLNGSPSPTPAASAPVNADDIPF